MRKHELKKAPEFTGEVLKLYPNVFNLVVSSAIGFSVLGFIVVLLSSLIPTFLDRHFLEKVLAILVLASSAYYAYFSFYILCHSLCMVTILPDSLVVEHPLLFRKQIITSNEIRKQRLVDIVIFKYGNFRNSNSLLIQMDNKCYVEFVEFYMMSFDKLLAALKNGKIKRSEKITAR